MGIVNDYRTAIISALQTQFGDTVPVVEKHSGKFDETEIKRLVAVTPAVYVATLGVTHDTSLSSGQDAPCILIGVFIFTEGEGDTGADEIGWDLAEQVFNLANQNVFGSPVWIPTHLEIENLWSSSIDNLNACIMGVSWKAQTVLGTDLDSSDMQLQTQTVGSPIFTVNEDGSFGAKQTPEMLDPDLPYDSTRTSSNPS